MPLRPLLLALLAATLALPGCASDNRVTLQSTTSSVRLDARFDTAAYLETAGTGAEIILTDLTLDELDPATDPAELTGRIVRISMVLRPKAGATPIDATAANTTIQYLILSRGAVGLYSGGGFLNPGKPLGRWGSSTIAGDIRGGALRLTAASARFDDRLGPATVDARFQALADEALARRGVEKFDAIVSDLYRDGK